MESVFRGKASDKATKKWSSVHYEEKRSHPNYQLQHTYIATSCSCYQNTPQAEANNEIIRATDPNLQAEDDELDHFYSKIESALCKNSTLTIVQADFNG